MLSGIIMSGPRGLQAVYPAFFGSPNPKRTTTRVTVVPTPPQAKPAGSTLKALGHDATALGEFDEQDGAGDGGGHPDIETFVCTDSRIQ